jgi:hypothetical protein
MKRTLLIAILIFAACASAPAQDSHAGARAEEKASPRQGEQLQASAGFNHHS